MATTKNPEWFEKKCLKIGDDLGIGVTFFSGEAYTDGITFHDDGTLHVVRVGVRACFDVSNSQSLSPKEQNDTTRKVMRALNLKVTDTCLVEDDEVSGNVCPHCGGSL